MYFDKFPRIKYRFPNNKTIEMADIFRSVKFSQETLSKPELFEEFFLTDGDRPEKIALDYYGDVKYYWVVLLANEIIDINQEWPRFSLNNLDNQNNLFYGYAFYFNDEMKIEKGDYIVKYDSGASGGVGDEYGVVDRYTPSLNKIEIRNNTFTSVTPGVKADGNDVGNFFIFRKNDDNSFSTLTSGVSGSNDFLPVERIDNLKDSVAYFKFDGRVINPLTKTNAAIDPSVVNYPTNNKKINSRTAIDNYIQGQKSTLDNRNVKVVTYSQVQGEASESSSKRIKLLRRDLLSDIVISVEDLIRDMNSGDVATIRKYVKDRYSK